MEDLSDAGVESPSSVEENLNFLKSRAQRLDQMLQDLVVYSKVGRSSHHTAVALDDALDHALRTATVPDEFVIERDFAASHLNTNADELAILFGVFLSNAVKHHQAPGGMVKFSSQAEKGGITLTISDDGPGIDEKFHEKIFEVMTTLKSRDEAEGSGMGLAIATKIVTHHGGTIQVTKTPATDGAEFSIFLPER